MMKVVRLFFCVPIHRPFPDGNGTGARGLEVSKYRSLEDSKFRYLVISIFGIYLDCVRTQILMYKNAKNYKM